MRAVLVILALLPALAGCFDAPAADVAPAAVVLPDLACVDGAAADACNAALSGPGPNEFSVAVNPLDPLNAIVTANDYSANDDQAVAVNGLWGSWWTTHDGGATWKKQTFGGMFPDVLAPLGLYAFVGDLVVTFAPDGTAHIAGIGYRNVGPLSRNAVFHATSADGGDTFTTPRLVDHAPETLQFRDKPAIAVDGEGRVYLAYILWDGLPEPAGVGSGMRWAVSEDVGATWRTQWLSFGDSGISASIALGPDGAVNVAWRAYDPYAIRFARSLDHGQTFSETTELRELTEMDLTLPNTSYRAFALPTLVATAAGTLHCIVADEGADKSSDVFLMTSRDDGATWNETLLEPNLTRGAQFLPTLALDPASGTLVAAWLDRSHDEADATYHLRVAVSQDDAATFTSRLVTREPSADEGEATFIGDYIGAAALDGRVYLAWPDLRDEGTLSALYAATLVVDEGLGATAKG